MGTGCRASSRELACPPCLGKAASPRDSSVGCYSLCPQAFALPSTELGREGSERRRQRGRRPLVESGFLQRGERALQPGHMWVLAPSAGEVCTLSSALTCNKMETRLFKGCRPGGCFTKPRSRVNVSGTRTVMQAHTKLFYLIEAEGTEGEKRNKSGRRANGSGEAPADLLRLLWHKVVRGGLTQADVARGIHGSSLNQPSWVKE